MFNSVTHPIFSFITRTCYRKEIFFVLALKLVMLIALWTFFFSHPIDHKLTEIQLVQHFIVTKYSG